MKGDILHLNHRIAELGMRNLAEIKSGADHSAGGLCPNNGDTPTPVEQKTFTNAQGAIRLR
jgi:hypothetical protein